MAARSSSRHPRISSSPFGPKNDLAKRGSKHWIWATVGVAATARRGEARYSTPGAHRPHLDPQRQVVRNGFLNLVFRRRAVLPAQRGEAEIVLPLPGLIAPVRIENNRKNVNQTMHATHNVTNVCMHVSSTCWYGFKRTTLRTKGPKPRTLTNVGVADSATGRSSLCHSRASQSPSV